MITLICLPRLFLFPNNVKIYAVTFNKKITLEATFVGKDIINRKIRIEIQDAIDQKYRYNGDIIWLHVLSYLFLNPLLHVKIGSNVLLYFYNVNRKFLMQPMWIYGLRTVTFKDLKKRVSLETTTQQQSRITEKLHNKPFWI